MMRLTEFNHLLDLGVLDNFWLPAWLSHTPQTSLKAVYSVIFQVCTASHFDSGFQFIKLIHNMSPNTYRVVVGIEPVPSTLDNFQQSPNQTGHLCVCVCMYQIYKKIWLHNTQMLPNYFPFCSYIYVIIYNKSAFQYLSKQIR